MVNLIVKTRAMSLTALLRQIQQAKRLQFILIQLIVDNGCLNVQIKNVFPSGGNVIQSMIVEMEVMKGDVGKMTIQQAPR
jgi:hypothetical protein